MPIHTEATKPPCHLLAQQRLCHYADNRNLDSSDPLIRRMLGCLMPKRDVFVGPYSSPAADPEPLLFTFEPEAVVQGIEILPEIENPERTLAVFTLMVFCLAFIICGFGYLLSNRAVLFQS